MAFIHTHKKKEKKKKACLDLQWVILISTMVLEADVGVNREVGGSHV